MSARRHHRAPRLIATAALALMVIVAAGLTAGGCGTQAAGAGQGKLDVVASESFLADIAQNVAGARFTVRSLIPLGTDPHSYEPVPQDVAEVAGADLLIINGGGLEGHLLDTLKSAGGSVAIVDASRGLTSRTPQPGEPPLESGGTDPHFWLDPVLVKTYVANIRDAFSRADPAGATVYQANAASYDEQLTKLDAWIRAQVATIPPQNRKLVMNHASHGYFADRYGFTVVGTVIPSVSTDETPTAAQLSSLTAAIKQSGARAIFVELDENPKLAEQIAAETHVKVVTDLLDHSLSKPGGPAPTYLDMMKYDTRLIVAALQ
jgi:ABC-type Zn uptake system ZnuABC Zn-binding protein ZnuA